MICDAVVRSVRPRPDESAGSTKQLRATLLVGVAALAFALSAAGALAATWHIRHAPPYGGGPTLAGDRVAWLMPRSDPGADPYYPPADLYIARPRQAPRRAQSFPAQFKPRQGMSLNYVFELASSSRYVGLQRFRFCESRFGGCYDQLDTFVGAVGSELQRVQRCQESVPSFAGISVSGHFAGFLRCDGKIIVRDLNNSQADLVLGVHGGSPQLAGRYVAWVEHRAAGTTDIVVYDRAVGHVAYTLAGDEVRRDPLVGFALQSDGTVAVSYDPHPNDTRVQARVAWASPEHPHVRRLPLPTRVFYQVRIDRGLIAFLRDPEVAARSPEPAYYELGVTDLRGNTQLFTRRAPRTSGFDIKGGIIAYALQTKHRGVAIRTRRVRVPWTTGS